MGREHPTECKHGTLMGGDESFGVHLVRCSKCDMSEIKTFNKKKVRAFPVEDELIERISALIHEYPDISNVSALGILEAVKFEFKPKENPDER